MAVAVQPQARAVGAPHFAGFWIRVLAFLIDGLAIGVVVSAVTLGRGGVVIWDHWFELVAWRNFIETVIGFVYFTFFWSAFGGGQTLGMRLLDLHVVGADGRQIGYGAAVVRWIGIVISAAAVLIGLLWVAFDPRKQGWHDKMAGSFVVHAGARGELASGAVAVERSVPHSVARAFAVGLGMLGAALGIVGVMLALIGDAVVAPGTELTVVGGLAAVALVASGLAWFKPSVAAVAFGAAVMAYWVALGPMVGPWYDGLQTATAAGPVAENQYWYDAPAMALFIASGIFLVLGGLLTLVGIDWGGE